MAHFSKDGFDLFFVAAHHGNEIDSKTFRLIRRVYERFKPRSAIVEGYPNEGGENPRGFIEEVKRTSDEHRYKWGESAFTAQLAWEHEIPFIGAEPTDKAVFDLVQKSGLSLNDFLGFYFTRQIQEYQRQGEIHKMPTARLFAQFMIPIHKNLGLAGYTQFPFSAFLKWYKEKNGEDFDPDRIDSETCAPLEQGKLFTQRVSHTVSLVRNRYILGVISNQLERHQKVLIVFGEGHLTVNRKAIEDAFGRPIYQGTLSESEESK